MDRVPNVRIKELYGVAKEIDKGIGEAFSVGLTILK